MFLELNSKGMHQIQEKEKKKKRLLSFVPVPVLDET